MALCFAHTTAGYLAYEAVRPAGPHRPLLLAGAVVLANAPDVDFVPGILIGHPGLFHRGITHTLAAVVAVTAIAWLVGRRRPTLDWTPLRSALWAGAVYASHLVLDYFTVDSRGPAGGQFLWPFSDAYWISPVTPLREIVIDGSSRVGFVRSLIAADTLPVWIEEVSILLGGLLLVAAIRALRAPAASPAVEDA